MNNNEVPGKQDFDSLTAHITKRGDDLAAFIARCFARMEECVDSNGTAIHDRLTDLEHKTESMHQRVFDEAASIRRELGGLANQ